MNQEHAFYQSLSRAQRAYDGMEPYDDEVRPEQPDECRGCSRLQWRLRGDCLSGRWVCRSGGCDV